MMAMKNIRIGTTPDGKAVQVDPLILSDTRALFSASSGLGKSWLLRLIAEHVASSIQTIIIDPEGEFSTLREKLDVLIVSENGDLRADIRSAGLLARKLAETGVSAVIDIYDLPGKEDPWVKRRMFVSQFISELMNLPKKFYHPMIVMVDEAHQFAQEETTSDSYVLNGVKVNPSILSRSAIRSLMSAGRKRGIGGMLATQRISKIDKDAIADARNIFIGGTTLDIDQRRAGDILGMNKSEFTSLRDLEPGTFYAFGPAVEGKGIVQFTSAKVQTTHPKAGQRSSIVVPKASTQIADIVDQFGDLPAIVEEEAKTLQTLIKENNDLKRELRARPTQTQTETKVERVGVPVITDEQIKALEDRAVDVKGITEELSEFKAEIVSLLNGKIEKLEKAGFDISAAVTEARRPSKPSQPARASIPVRTAKPVIQKQADFPTSETGSLTGPQQRILDAIAWFENIGNETPSQVAVAFLAGYTYGGGAFNNPRGALRSMGLVEYARDSISLTSEGRKYASIQQSPLTAEKLQSRVMNVLPGPHKKILSVLIDAYPNALPKRQVAELSGYAEGGAFNNPLGRLRSMGLVDYPQPGYAVAESLLFLE
jgi:hypothetical protein